MRRLVPELVEFVGCAGGTPSVEAICQIFSPNMSPSVSQCAEPPRRLGCWPVSGELLIGSYASSN